MLLQQHLEMVKGAELTTMEVFLTCLSSAQNCLWKHHSVCTGSHIEVNQFSSVTWQLLKPSSTLQEKPVPLLSHEPDCEIRSDDFHTQHNCTGRKML